MSSAPDIKADVAFKGYNANQDGSTRIKLEFPASYFQQAIEMLVFIENRINVQLKADYSTGPAKGAMSSAKYSCGGELQRLAFYNDGTAQLWLKSHVSREKADVKFFVVAPNSGIKARFRLI